MNWHIILHLRKSAAPSYRMGVGKWQHRSKCILETMVSSLQLFLSRKTITIFYPVNFLGSLDLGWSFIHGWQVRQSYSQNQPFTCSTAINQSTIRYVLRHSTTALMAHTTAILFKRLLSHTCQRQQLTSWEAIRVKVNYEQVRFLNSQRYC